MKTQTLVKIIVLLIASVFASFACNSGKDDEKAEKKSFSGVGIIKAINTEKGEITIEHEKIEGLMSAMTMDFPTADKKLLEMAKVGDRVEFELEKEEAEIVITKIKKTGEIVKSNNGSEIFKTNCAKCHGENGNGVKDKGISFLEGHALHHTEEDFIKRVTNGKKDEMPAFKDKLSEEEIKMVVSFVREEIQSEVNKKDDTSHEH